ncbi:MAG: efflux RND transporter periplasmic adaptor subunit [Fibrobacter sp.]|mgnify:CR=1 FL=1|nr:efflux RND transporter periplasmic adaptor subunit [Fibrobacter sp.]
MQNSILLVLILLSAQSLLAQGRLYTGITEPIAQAHIGMTVPGIIDSIWVREGNFVRQGDTLLNLSKAEEEIVVQMRYLAMQDQAELQAAVAKKEAAQKDYVALENLHKHSSSVSEAQLWEKKRDFLVAQAEWEKAMLNKSQDSLEYATSQAQLAHRYMLAPFDGEIVSITKNRAESVNALEAFVEIADVRTCRLTAYLSVSQAKKIKKDQKIRLQLGGDKKTRTRHGVVEFISPVVDKASLLRTVKVVFDNSDGSIEPGVSGNIITK